MNDLYLSEAIQHFILHLQATGRQPATIQSYSKCLHWLLDELDDVTLDSITDVELSKTIVRLHQNSTRSDPRSPVTMNRIKSTYRSFFTWCFQTARISKNLSLALPLSRSKTRRTPAISEDEIVRMLTTIRNSLELKSQRDYALFSIYIFTGIRRSEALSTRLKDYNCRNHSLHLPFTKGGQSRSIVIPRFLGTVLNDYIAWIVSSDSISSDSFLFPGRIPTQSITCRQIQHRFELWKKSSGLRNELSIQSLRAGFASIVYKHTGDRQLVSRLLGHSESLLSQHYVFMETSEVLNAIENSFQPVISRLLIHHHLIRNG